MIKVEDIYITLGEYEETKPDKHSINIIYDSNAVHFIVGGHGWCNGEYLGAGDGFMCVKDEFCSYYPDKNDPWKYVWFRIEGQGSEKFISRFSDNKNIFRFEMTDNFVPMCQAMLSSNDMHSREYSSAVFGVLRSFFGDYADIEEKSLADMAENYMRQNYYKKVTIKEIADKLCISRAYLRNIFFDATGKSPKAYITQLRMHRACYLLRTNRFTVAETAASVGYDDTFCFSKIFKKHTGLSPTEYKNQNSISSSSSATSKVQSSSSDNSSS